MTPNPDISFLYEIGSLKNLERGWRQNLAMDYAVDKWRISQLDCFGRIL